jgi:tetratricopeptide (TPR) repeat protein
MGRVKVFNPAPISMVRFLCCFFVFLVAVFAFPSFAQTSKPSTIGVGSATEHALKLVESGHCVEALPLLKKSITAPSSKELERKVGFTGLRCAMTSNRPDQAVDFLQLLLREFPRDPEVLYVAVHTYSDLSTRAGEELTRSAPDSYEAHELVAESLELQGKWDEAAKEYRAVLARNAQLPGIHFRLGRLLISKPNPAPSDTEEAKKEFEQELAIDPTNAGAEFLLGELARQAGDWPEAADRFESAIKLDANFGDAYLGLGVSLLAAQKYAEAIPPLETAVKLEPANPTAHYNLATAYSRAGRKHEADVEFAIHQKMIDNAGDKAASPN